jgi:hypothetical protein
VPIYLQGGAIEESKGVLEVAILSRGENGGSGCICRERVRILVFEMFRWMPRQVVELGDGERQVLVPVWEEDDCVVNARGGGRLGVMTVITSHVMLESGRVELELCINRAAQLVN